jgi:hypothetical protein
MIAGMMQQQVHDFRVFTSAYRGLQQDSAPITNPEPTLNVEAK